MDEALQAAIEHHTHGPNWWTVGAIVFSATIGGFIALLSVAKHRIIAKKKAAHDFILILWSDPVQKAEMKFREFLSHDKILRIFDANTPSEIDEKVQVQHFLNHYELLAGSIRNNIIDEYLCKDLVIDDVFFAYDKGFPIIEKLRSLENDDGFYCELEWLAKRWKADPYPTEKRSWLIESIREIGRI